MSKPYTMNQRETQIRHSYLLKMLDEGEPELIPHLQRLMDEFAPAYCEPVCRFDLKLHTDGLLRIDIHTIHLDKAPVGSAPVDTLEAVEIALNRFIGVLEGLGFSGVEWWRTDPHGQDSPVPAE